MTIIEFLRDMVNMEGLNSLSDGNRINGYLADYFPDSTKERAAIRVANSLGYGRKIYNLAAETDRKLQSIKIEQLRKQLCDEVWLNPEAADYVIRVYASAASISMDRIRNSSESERNKTDIKADSAELEKLKNRISVLEKENLELRDRLQYIQAEYNNILSQYQKNTKKYSDDFEKEPDFEDESRAFVWYSHAAEKGNMEAAYKLCLMYGKIGRYEEATRYCIMAAQGGNAEAQLQYGIMLQKGIGVPANQQLALQWLRRSADLGNEEAKKRHTELLKTVL